MLGTGSQTTVGFSWANILIMVVLFGAMIWSLWRRRQTGSKKLAAAMGLLSSVNDNLRISNQYLSRSQTMKKFKVKSWNKYKDKIDFLSPELQASINETFTLANECNRLIEEAQKTGSTAYLATMPVDKMPGLISTCRQGLIEWLRANIQQESSSSRRRGLFGW